MEGHMEHRPYTSVRKLFYNYPTKIMISSCDDDIHSERRLNGCCNHGKKVFINGKQEVRERICFKPLSKSLHFHGSYSDFYCEDPSKMKSSLKKTSWLSRSENKLNVRFLSRFNSRVRSLDNFRFKNLQRGCYDSSEEPFNEYEIYNDTDSCFKCSVDNDSNGEDADNVFGNLSPGRQSRSTLNSHHTETSSLFGNVPWTKRMTTSKEKKRKRKHKRRSPKISDSFDFIRNMWLNDDERAFSCDSESGRQIDDYVTPANIESRVHSSFCPADVTSLTDNVTKCRFCCDGAFGCT